MRTPNIQHSTFNIQWPIVAMLLMMMNAQGQTVRKGAQVQMESARASFVAALPSYIQIQFDVDPNNGTAGYVNFTTYLQTSGDWITWRDIGSVSGPTNGAFAVPVLRGTNQFFRTRLDQTR